LYVETPGVGEFNIWSADREDISWIGGNEIGEAELDERQARALSGAVDFVNVCARITMRSDTRLANSSVGTRERRAVK
jgi:hypothetical protein